MRKKQFAVTGTNKQRAILTIEEATRVGEAINANPTVFTNPHSLLMILLFQILVQLQLLVC